MRHGERGFTLIELMVVVAIVGVLIAVAVFMYQRYVRQTKSASEVAYVFGEMKLKEEAFALDNAGSYLSTGADETDMWPATIQEDNPTTIAPIPATWTSLGMALDRNGLYCQYVAIAGDGGDATNIGGKASGDFGFGDPDPPTNNWYYLLAQCDFDNNPTLNAWYFATSDANGIQRENQGH